MFRSLPRVAHRIATFIKSLVITNNLNTSVSHGNRWSPPPLPPLTFNFSSRVAAFPVRTGQLLHSWPSEEQVRLRCQLPLLFEYFPHSLPSYFFSLAQGRRKHEKWRARGQPITIAAIIGKSGPCLGGCAFKAGIYTTSKLVSSVPMLKKFCVVSSEHYNSYESQETFEQIWSGPETVAASIKSRMDGRRICYTSISTPPLPPSPPLPMTQ